MTFFKDLVKWLKKTDNLNYKHVKQILRIFRKNMTDKERTQYDFWFFQCLKSISTQLDIKKLIKNGE